MKKTFSALVILTLTACSHSSSETRKVSNWNESYAVPSGTRTLFRCYNQKQSETVQIVVNHEMEDAKRPSLGDGTTKVLSSLRKIGSDKIKFQMVGSFGTEPLYYNAPIAEDLHKGKRWIRAEDIEWPRGLWENNRAELLFHPDSSHSTPGASPATDVEVELRYKDGETWRCGLAIDLEFSCC